MKQLIAVTRLDLRRLSFPLLACALVAGLTPAFASGLGSPVSVDAVLAVAFIVVGVAAGGTFGYDFAEGRGSFFFARPLPALTLVAGRILSGLLLATGTFVSVMAAHWVSTSDAATFHFLVLSRTHAYTLGTAWTMGLYLGLAAATQARSEEGPRSIAAVAAVVIRVTVILAVTMLVFGLFADLVLRAYLAQGPARLFFGSFVWGAFAASVAGIMAGRTDRLRIARIQNTVMAGVAVVTSVSVSGVWLWALSPGPENILAIKDVEGSPDGRFAYIHATVDRGDPATYRPTFIVDLASGATRLLKTDPFQGPWTSADGKVMTWAEGTPVFFRPLIRKVGGGSHYRMQAGEGLPLTIEVPLSMRGLFVPGPRFLIDSVSSITPSTDGDLFAIQSPRELRFMSRTRGEFPEVKLPGGASARRGAIQFLPNGLARAATVVESGGQSQVTVVDIEPRTGAVTEVATLSATRVAGVRFDKDASRALISTTGAEASRGSAFLIQMGAASAPREIVAESRLPMGLFLDDGRIAIASGDRATRTLQVFSREGDLLRSIPLREGVGFPSIEMFPGVVAMPRSYNGPEELELIDCGTGATLRSLKGLRAIVGPVLGWRAGYAPPPGSPGARLVISPDGSLNDLPSLQGEPRRIHLQPLP